MNILEPKEDRTRQTWLKYGILLLICLGGLVYFDALLGKFVWDDKVFISQNPEIPSINLVSAFGPNTFNSSGYYRPIPAVYFGLLFQLFGQTPLFYHLVQICLHIANTSLLFIFFTAFFSPAISLCLAAVFLVHPMQVESVAFIGATQSELFFLFGICALLRALKKQSGFINELQISLLLFLSLLVKEVGLLFYFLVYALRRLKHRAIDKTWLGFQPATLVIYLLLRLRVGGVVFQKISLVPIARLPLLERAVSIPDIFFYYLKTFAFPIFLSIEQQWYVTGIDWAHFFLPLAADLTFFVGLFFIGRRIYQKAPANIPTFVFFAWWFGLGQSMLLQIFPLDMTVADRWFYFPMAGLLGLIGATAASVKFPPTFSYNLKLSLVIVVILLSLRTVVRNLNWHDPLTLFSHDIQIQDNFDLENWYGVELDNNGQLDQALQAFSKSVSMDPMDSSLSNLGVDLDQINSTESAGKAFNDSLEAVSYDSPGHRHVLPVYLNYANYLLRHGQATASAQFLTEKAFPDYPEQAGLWQMLAVAQYRQGLTGPALISAQKAVDLTNSPSTRYVYEQIFNKKPIPNN